MSACERPPASDEVETRSGSAAAERPGGSPQESRGAGAPVQRGRLEVVTIAGVCVVALWITARLLIRSDLARNNVYLKVYAPAAEAFWAQHDLYRQSGFRYPPLCAALLWPFAACGPVLGSIVWRALNLAVLLLGLRAYRRAVLPDATSNQRALVLALTVFCGLGSLNNGQANALMLGCMLLAAARTLQGRTAVPAVAIAAATTCKVYPFAFGCVLAVLRPRLWLGLALGVVAVAALPYALAPASYVNAQYAQLFEVLRNEDRTLDLDDSYRDLRLLVTVLGAPMPAAVFLALQAGCGLLIAVVAWLLQRRAGAVRAVTFATSAVLCWCLLLGPATEKVTYQLLGPPLAWLLLEAWRTRVRARQWFAAIVLLLVLVDGTWAPRYQLRAGRPWLRCGAVLATLLVAIDLGMQAAYLLRARPGATLRRPPADG